MLIRLRHLVYILSYFTAYAATPMLFTIFLRLFYFIAERQLDNVWWYEAPLVSLLHISSAIYRVSHFQCILRFDMLFTLRLYLYLLAFIRFWCYLLIYRWICRQIYAGWYLPRRRRAARHDAPRYAANTIRMSYRRRQMRRLASQRFRYGAVILPGCHATISRYHSDAWASHAINANTIMRGIVRLPVNSQASHDTTRLMVMRAIFIWAVATTVYGAFILHAPRHVATNIMASYDAICYFA